MTGLIGTAHWMAPEVLMSRPDYDTRVDVYSFGIFVWELLTGGMPYKGMKQADITIGVISGSLRPPLPADCPPALKALIEKCWAQEPDDRPFMSDVVAQLASPVCHFTGTDETEFIQRTGLVPARHVKTHSGGSGQRRRKHRTRDSASTEAIPDTSEPKFLVAVLTTTTGKHRVEQLQFLAKMLADPSYAERFGAAGGCEVIAQALRESWDGTPELLAALALCDAPSLFQVEILKSLLNFSGAADKAVKAAALTVLIHASNLRFDFLSSTPSFLSQLLAFSSREIDRELLISLFQETKKLLSTFATIASGLGSQLMHIMKHSESAVKPHVLACLAEAMRFSSTQAEFNTHHFGKLLSMRDQAREAIANFFTGTESTPNDGPFFDQLYELKKAEDVWKMLVDIGKNPRFADHVLRHLPIGDDTRTSSAIYPTLLSNPDFFPTLVRIPEFYAVASYFIATGEFALICDALKRMSVDPEILLQSRLCEFLAKAVKPTAAEDALIGLMAAVFSVLRAAFVPHFVPLISLFLDFLRNSDRPHLKKPAFLCLVALSAYQPDGIDYPTLAIAASGYVNSESPLVAEYGGTLLTKHLTEEGVDLNTCMGVFLKNYRQANEYTAAALKAFQKAAQTQEIAPALLTKISGLWKRPS
jgi:hypothetical protein